MEGFPIPKLRSSWVAALILSIVAFSIYYLFAFNLLLKLYESQFNTLEFAQEDSEIKVTAFVPKYYNPSEPVLTYINVKNESDEPIYDLEVYLVAISDEPTFLLPNLYDKDVHSSVAEIKVLEPNATATARLSIITQEPPEIKQALIINAGKESRTLLNKQAPIEDVRPNKDSYRALQHGFLEIILVPPWSNAIILGVVVFSTYLVRTRKEEDGNRKTKGKDKDDDEPDTFTVNWWAWVIQDLEKSLRILSSMVILATLFILATIKTLSPISCLAALLLMWFAAHKWYPDLLETLKSKIILISMFLARFGFWSSSLILLLISIQILFPDFDVSWTPTLQLIIQIVVLLITTFAFVRERTFAAKVILKLLNLKRWGGAFLILSIFYLLIVFIGGQSEFSLREIYPSLEELYSWWLLIFGSIVVLLWKELFDWFNRQYQFFVKSLLEYEKKSPKK